MLRWREARARRQAAAWLARINAPDGERHRPALNAWLKADPRNCAAFNRMQSIWGLAGRVDVGAVAPPADEWSLVGGRRVAWAAAGFLLLGIALVLTLAGGSRVTGHSEQIASLVTQTGEIRSHELADGSVVVLDTQTVLEIRFGASQRRLTLRQGRVRVSAAADPRPLIVAGGGREVRLNEGSFDVEANAGQLAVSILQGEAELPDSSSEPDGRFRAGERAVFAGSQPPRLGRADPPGRWINGMLDFDDVPLAEAAAAANRYSDTKVELADPGIARLRVTGAFRAGDVRGLARALASAFGLRIEEGDRRIILRR